MLILLDSNAFWADVYAEKPWLSAVLDGARHGDFEVVVPETVVRELVRQFPERLSEATRDANAAIGAAAKSLRRLGVRPPGIVEVDEDALANDYESRIRRRLSGPGCRIEPDPNNLGQAIDWAVDRRKPFKSSGEGLPDAAIWLTALGLASQGYPVLLVSTNTEDFGDGKSPAALAPELVEDLTAAGCLSSRVRLLTDVKQLVDEVVAPMAQAEARAERLIADVESAGRVRQALEEALLYAPIPQGDLRLGVDLDNDPQPIGLDIGTLELSSVREVDEGELLIRLRALCDLHLDMAVYKADFALADDDSPVSVSREDLNDHYFQGEAEILAWVTLDIQVDPLAEDVEVEPVVEAERLSEEEVLELRLREGAGDPILEAIRDPANGGEMSVSNYIPDIPLESRVDQALVETLRPTAVFVDTVEGRSQEGVRCALLVDCEGDVAWVVSAPSGIDSGRYPNLSENPDEGGWISDVEEHVPLRLRLWATLTLTGEWVDLEPDEIVVPRGEVQRRSVRELGVQDDEILRRNAGDNL